MLTNDDLLVWFQRLDFPDQTRSAISHIRSVGPARRVGGGKSNVAGRYPSRKMGVSIQFESHRVEMAGVYEMEHDAGVLEYFDQPPTIKLDYESPAGKRMGVLHTPDFFVIREKEAGWEEWKTEEELQRLSERNSNRYSAGEDGRWRCPPGAAYAERLGLITASDHRRRSTGCSNETSSSWRTIFGPTRRKFRLPAVMLPWRMYRQRPVCHWRIWCN